MRDLSPPAESFHYLKKVLLKFIILEVIAAESTFCVIWCTSAFFPVSFP